MRMVALLTICLALWPCVGLAADTANSLPESEDLLDSVQMVADHSEARVDWLAVTRAIAKLGELGEREAGPVLIDILRREEPLRLEEGVPLPGVMPPLEMVKAAAIDALVKLEAKEGVPELERIARTADFKLLRDQAREASSAIQQQ